MSLPDDPRTEEQLNVVVSGLLKGCLYHFDKAVTRISWMTSVIPSDDKAEFRHKCKKLLTVGEVEFFEIAADIQRKWPRTQTWMNWWLIPENAQMLFTCMRKMTPALAASVVLKALINPPQPI